MRNLGDRGKRRGDDSLVGKSAVGDDGRRGSRLHADRTQLGGDRLQRTHSHEENQRGPAAGKRGVVQARVRVAGWNMARHDREPLRQSSVRHGDADSLGHRDAGGDSRDHPGRDARLAARLQLFEATTEDKGVAALEANHVPARERPINQDPIDLLLAGRPSEGDLGHVNDFGVRPGPGQGLPRSEPVEHHHIRIRDGVPARDGHQVDRPGSPADQGHLPLAAPVVQSARDRS